MASIVIVLENRYLFSRRILEKVYAMKCKYFIYNGVKSLIFKLLLSAF